MRLGTAEEVFAEADKNIHEPQQRAKLEEIRVDFALYVKAVTDLKQFTEERVETVKRLAKLGEAIGANLAAIRESVERAGNAAAAAAIGELNERLLLSRLNTLYFIGNNDQTYIDKVPGLLGDAFAAELATVRQAVTDDELLRRLDQVQKDSQDYVAGAAAIKKAVLARNAVVEDVLAKVGSRMTAAAEEVKLMIKGEQDALGPKVESANRMTIFIGIGVALFGLIGSIVLARLLTKAITDPDRGGRRHGTAVRAGRARRGDRHSPERRGGPARRLLPHDAGPTAGDRGADRRAGRCDRPGPAWRCAPTRPASRAAGGA